jgi:RHS repeat-associated protein
MVDESENAPRYTFSTKEFLSDAKLYLYAYRVYDPVAGRWTQRDPIDYEDSLNLYQFCGNNALNKTDATGELAVTLTVVAIVVIGGAIGITVGKAMDANIEQQSRAMQSLDVEGLSSARQNSVAIASATLEMCSVGTFALDAASGIMGASEKVGGKVITSSMPAKYSQNLSKGTGGYMMNVPGQGNRIVSRACGSQVVGMQMQNIAAQSATKATVTAAKGASDIVPDVVAGTAGIIAEK